MNTGKKHNQYDSSNQEYENTTMGKQQAGNNTKILKYLNFIKFSQNCRWDIKNVEIPYFFEKWHLF